MTLTLSSDVGRLVSVEIGAFATCAWSAETAADDADERVRRDPGAGRPGVHDVRGNHRVGHDDAEQAVLLRSRAGREVQRVHVAAIAAVAELQAPKAVDLDVLAGLVLQRAEERRRYSGRRR